MDRIERSYLRKVARRVIPILFAGILLGYLDRANIAYASLRMNADLGLSPAQYGWAASIFYLGFIAFEIPGTIALRRLGARFWMTFLVLAWGVISVAMAFVHDVHLFFLLRFLLGASEAGFFPGSVLFLAYWLPERHRSALGAYVMVGVPLAMFVGGPAAAGLMQLGALGLRGWQWLFLAEALPCFLLAAVFALLLRDTPAHATWLTSEEKAWIADAHAAEDRAKPIGVHAGWRSLLDWRLVLLCTVTFGGPAVGTGVMFWLPQIMQSFGLSIVETGLLSALPFAIAGAALWWWGAHSDRVRERKWHLALPSFVSAFGLFGSLLVAAPLAKFLFLLVASLGLFAFLPVAWAASHALFRGPIAPVGYAIISMSGALAGLIAPGVMGFLRQVSGSHEAGIIGLIAIAILSGIGGLAFGASAERAESRLGRLRPADA